MPSSKSSSDPGKFSHFLSNVGVTLGGIIAASASFPLYGEIGAVAAAPAFIVGMALVGLSGVVTYHHSKSGQTEIDRQLETLVQQNKATMAAIEELRRDSVTNGDHPDYRLRPRPLNSNSDGIQSLPGPSDQTDDDSTSA